VLRPEVNIAARQNLSVISWLRRGKSKGGKFKIIRTNCFV
jgi:hypothetical protein